MRYKSTFFKIALLWVLSLNLLLSCKKDDGVATIAEEEEIVESTEKEEILFIGNSHTFFNRGIPNHLSSFREHDDLSFTPLIRDAAKAGYTLQDHLGDSQSVSIINERRWDVLVLQENSFVAAEERDETIEAIMALNDMVATKGTVVYLFMTWPYEDQPEMLAAIKRIYARASTAINAKVVPVGEAWRTINNDNPHDINMYAQDGVHPSFEGTYYATAMFYREIYKQLPSSNSYQAGLPPAVATYLKEQAD